MKLEKVIIMMGPPGSGKGTQSKLLIEKLGYAYFSMGDAFRELALQDTPLARKIKATIDQGMIVADDLTSQVFNEAIDKKVVNKTGLIIDGFPRTQGQLRMLDDFLARQGNPEFHIFFLEVDKLKLLKRLSLRKTCPNCQAIYLPSAPEYQTEVCKVCGHKISIRKDDADIAFIEKRFDEYQNKTAPIKDYYESKGILIHIQGDQSENAEESIKDVHQTIMAKISK